MALSQPQTMSHTEALRGCSPVLPEFQTDADKLHDINYLTAMEAEHSRDLYLQGAIAVGQIVRLLEELCVEADGEEIIDDLSAAPFEDRWDSQSLPYDKRCHIEAWVHAVELPDREWFKFKFTRILTVRPGPERGIDDVNETGEQSYHRGAFIVCDTVDSEVPEDLFSCIRDDGRAKIHRSVLDGLPVTRSPQHTSENPELDLVQRMKYLIARLDKLEVDIDEFSKDTCDALTRLDLELAADMDNCVDVDDDIDAQLDFALRVFGFRLVPTCKEGFSRLPISGASTTTKTSDVPPATLREVEGQPRDSVKGLDCFWSCV